MYFGLRLCGFAQKRETRHTRCEIKKTPPHRGRPLARFPCNLACRKFEVPAKPAGQFRIFLRAECAAFGTISRFQRSGFLKVAREEGFKPVGMEQTGFSQRFQPERMRRAAN